jgi:uncharacterized protein (TIGR02118 family)
MAQMIVIYDPPADPGAFEDYYANQHLPLAGEKLPGVSDVQAYRVDSNLAGSDPDVYRMTVVSWPSQQAMQDALASDGGREVVGDLENFAAGRYAVLFGHDA